MFVYAFKYSSSWKKYCCSIDIEVFVQKYCDVWWPSIYERRHCLLFKRYQTHISKTSSHMNWQEPHWLDNSSDVILYLQLYIDPHGKWNSGDWQQAHTALQWTVCVVTGPSTHLLWLWHKVNKNIKVLPLNHVFIDELWHDGDGHGCRRGGQNVLDLRILKFSQWHEDLFDKLNTIKYYV